MSRGFPSMTALLGLLAMAGYQNRDKIAEMLRGLGQPQSGASGQGGLGGLLGQLTSSLGGASAGGLLSGGLGELIDRFKQAGQGETAESWVKTGPNEPTGFILTTILGIVGAFVATFLGQALGWYRADEGAGLIGAVIGAVVVLFLWSMLARRNTTSV